MHKEFLQHHQFCCLNSRMIGLPRYCKSFLFTTCTIISLNFVLAESHISSHLPISHLHFFAAKILLDSCFFNCFGGEVSKVYYSPPARWGLLDFVRVVLLLLLLDSLSSSSSSSSLRLLVRLLPLLFHFHVHGCLANSSPSSSPTSELSVHRWTSTWDLPSSVCTAGPQSGTFPAQCAPLNLNGQIDCQKICQIERQKECQKECQKICQIKCQNVCQIECQEICQIECQKVCQIECQIECQIKCKNVCQNICQKICQIECQKICQKICAR